MHQRDGARDLDQPQEESVAVVAEEERPQSDLFSAPAHENESKIHQASATTRQKRRGQRKYCSACARSVQRILRPARRLFAEGSQRQQTNILISSTICVSTYLSHFAFECLHQNLCHKAPPRRTYLLTRVKALGTKRRVEVFSTPTTPDSSTTTCHVR